MSVDPPTEDQMRERTAAAVRDLGEHPPILLPLGGILGTPGETPAQTLARLHDLFGSPTPAPDPDQ